MKSSLTLLRSSVASDAAFDSPAVRASKAKFVSVGELLKVGVAGVSQRRDCPIAPNRMATATLKAVERRGECIGVAGKSRGKRYFHNYHNYLGCGQFSHGSPGAQISLNRCLEHFRLN